MEKRTRATIIDKAKAEVEGFSTMYAKLEQKVVLGGISESTLTNYGRCIAQISLHFNHIYKLLFPNCQTNKRFSCLGKQPLYYFQVPLLCRHL
jgi:hypothetical protein